MGRGRRVGVEDVRLACYLAMVLILRGLRGGVLKCYANGVRGISVAEDEWVER